MTDKTDNELIAEFMGWTIEGEPEFKKPYEVWKSETGTLMYPRTDPQGNRYPEKFQFHTSWDWLMPVVEKIESLGCIVEMWLSLGKGCRITHPVQGEYHHVVTEGNQTIEVVYKAVVSFIERYNQQPK